MSFTQRQINISHREGGAAASRITLAWFWKHSLAGQIPASSKTQLTSHPYRKGFMQMNSSYLTPLYLLKSNTHFWFPCHLNKGCTTLMKKSFPEKAMWACLAIAQLTKCALTSAYSTEELITSRKEKWGKTEYSLVHLTPQTSLSIRWGTWVWKYRWKQELLLEYSVTQEV